MHRELQILAEVHLAEAISKRDLVYEGRTDLTAVITKSNNVEIYQLGGQKAFDIELDDLSGKPTSLSWTRKGELLLIGTDSGLVDQLYTRTGKVSPGDRRGADHAEDVPVTRIGSHVATIDGQHRSINTNTHSNGAQNDNHGLTVEDWFDQMNLEAGSTVAARHSKHSLQRLPQALASVNPGDVMPRLSAISLPSKAGPGMPTPALRSTHKDLHSLLNNRPSHSPDGVEVTFLSLDNGDVDGSIGELFTHKFKSKASTSSKTLLHCSHNVSDLHAILRGAYEDGQAADGKGIYQSMELALFDIPFTSSSSVHTSTILSSATQLKLVELYITQTIDTVLLDWNTLTSLPARFIANINETLEEKQEGLLAPQLYQLLLTGQCSDAVIEWLKEELAERGHKRWDHAMTTFYHAISQLFEVNLLPALERIVLIASTLRGLATYYEGSKRFDVSPTFFTKIIEVVGCIHLLVHEALQISGREERQFRAFSSWLRHQIDIAAAEPGSTAAIELAEREAMSTDVPKILSYLEEAFAGSKLQAFVGRRLQATEINTKLASIELTSESTSAAIRGARAGQESSADALYIPIHLANLQKKVEVASAQMRRWQSTTWLHPEEIKLEITSTLSALDVNMTRTDGTSSPGSCITIAGVDAAAESTLIIHTVSVARLAGSSFRKTTSQDSWTIQLSSSVEAIIDLRLLFDRSVLCLAQIESQHILVHLPRNVTTKVSDLTISAEDLEHYTIHVFTKTRFEPGYIYVSDNPRRRNVLILDKSCQWWKVFRLPADMNGNGKVQDDQEDEGEPRQSPFGLDGSQEDMMIE
ncbi:Anaphase-promoting complex subunit 4-like protein [Elsinoe fawcettii]|nr:Anaphase-promoting complex subunit 4-like protein [Elsinoe fawcettii]